RRRRRPLDLARGRAPPLADAEDRDRGGQEARRPGRRTGRLRGRGASARGLAHARRARGRPLRALSSGVRASAEQLGLMVRAERGDELVELALHHAIQRVERELDAVIRDAVLRVVVRADLLRALARADHRAALVADRLGALALGHLVELGAEDLHRARQVLVLGALLLRADADARGDVAQVDGAHRGVHALSARAARRRLRDLEVLLVDLDLDLVGLRHHGHGRGRGVDATGALGGGDALHAVHAGLETERAVDAIARDDGDDLLDAARRGLAHRGDLHLPALGLGVAAVHAEEIGREERRLLAARPRADLEEDVALVVGILGQEEDLDLAFDLGDLGLELGELLGGELAQLGIGERGLVLGDSCLELLVARVLVYELGELGALTVELGEALSVRRDLGAAEHLFELAVPRDQAVELLLRQQAQPLKLGRAARKPAKSGKKSGASAGAGASLPTDSRQRAASSAAIAISI